MRNSRTHPANHSNIEPFFSDVAPLEEDEIEALIEGQFSVPPYMDPTMFGELCGVTRQTAGRWISGAGIEPVCRGRMYRTADLMKARETYQKGGDQ